MEWGEGGKFKSQAMFTEIKATSGANGLSHIQLAWNSHEQP